MTIRDLLELLQSSRKIVFVLTFGALLILLQEEFFKFFIIDDIIKTISFITLILGGLFFIWDIFEVVYSKTHKFLSSRISQDELDFLHFLWKFPSDVAYLQISEIDEKELSNLKIIITDLVDKGFIGGDFFDNRFYLKEEGKQIVKKYLKKLK